MELEITDGMRKLYGRLHQELNKLPQTNWWVITGPPNSGKSPLINYLAFEGYRIVPEAARLLIDEEVSRGKTLEEIRGNEASFQRRVFRMKRRPEEIIPYDQLCFFDRGREGDDAAYWVNAIEYHEPVSLPVNFLHGIALGLETRRRYKGIFLLDGLPSYQRDYAKTEDAEEAKRIAQLLEHYYGTVFGYRVFKVPILPISERAQLILDHVNSIS